MFDIIVTIVGAALTGIFGLIGWVITLIFSRLNLHAEKHDDLVEDFNNHKVHVAQNFATKPDVRDMKEELVSFLTRIEDKLDKKVDK